MSSLTSLANAIFAATGPIGGVGVMTRGAGADAVSGQPVQIRLGKCSFAVDDGTGARIEAEENDLIVQSASLVLGGVRTLPAQGDTWSVVPRGHLQPKLYEVMDPPYKNSDAAGVNLRVHVKRIA